MGATESAERQQHAGSLKQLTSMGFSEEQSVVALEVSAGNVQRAAQLLLEQQEQLGTPRQQAPAPPVPTGSSGMTPEQRVQQCAQRLAGRAEAVDVLTTSLARILQSPHDEKFRKVNISNPKFQQYVASAPGGMEFMYAVGFEPMHGYLVNQRQDLALLWLGKSALEALRTDAAYQHSKEDAQVRHALSLSRQEYEVSTETQRAAFLSRVPEEPPDGAAGNAKICFHVGQAQTWRRFESCSTLEDLLNFARSLPGTPLGAVRLLNVTMSPHQDLDIGSQLGLTLQRLDLWPAGHVRIEAA